MTILVPVLYLPLALAVGDAFDAAAGLALLLTMVELLVRAVEGDR